MRLRDLLSSSVDVSGVGDLEVTSVEIDSRRCRSGSLFFALPGGATDGALFVDDAVSNGATAVVSCVGVNSTVPVITVPIADIHHLMVRSSAAICSHPEDRVTLFGVTGTNGKTSVSTLLTAMWRELGRESDVIGTLTHERTTPAPPELYRELDRVALSSATRPLVGIEVSSHALSQGRVDGLIFDVAAFTNLSQDHLDYHGTMERYCAAKSSLFVPERCRHGVIWIDDEYGRRLATMTGVPVTTVQRTEATHVEMSLGATNFTWRGRRAHSGLSGQYNLDNVLVVLACALELGLSESDAVDALAGVPAVAGRFDVVATSSPTVIVDYAHTPDGLERLLRDVRSLSARRRLVVVFGCGGDRDRSKRPVMGEIVTRLADEVIVTSDNPRNEDPNAIIDEIVVGCTGPAPWRRVVDRRLAIGEAISTAGDDDVVVIAGKGHERTQTIGSTVLEFDDRVVAREYVR